MKEIDRHIAGFWEFHKEFVERHAEEYAELTHGQHPRTMVIACSDSRVSPEILTKCGPGDFFTVRNVANLVPRYSAEGLNHGVSAALEFAVCHLGVRHIIVFGHSHCGGIAALMAENCPLDREFVDRWMAIADPARQRVAEELPDADHEARLRAVEKAAIRYSVENLSTFPFVKQRVDAGELFLHGWFFDMDAAELLEFDHGVGELRPLTREGAPV